MLIATDSKIKVWKFNPSHDARGRFATRGGGGGGRGGGGGGGSGAAKIERVFVRTSGHFQGGISKGPGRTEGAAALFKVHPSAAEASSIRMTDYQNTQGPHLGGNPNYRTSYVHAKFEVMKTGGRKDMVELHWQVYHPETAKIGAPPSRPGI